MNESAATHSGCWGASAAVGSLSAMREREREREGEREGERERERDRGRHGDGKRGGRWRYGNCQAFEWHTEVGFKQWCVKSYMLMPTRKLPAPTYFPKVAATRAAVLCWAPRLTPALSFSTHGFVFLGIA